MRKILIHGGNSEITLEFLKLSQNYFNEFHLNFRSKKKYKYKFINKKKIFFYQSDLKNSKQTIKFLQRLPNDITDILWVSGYSGKANLEFEKSDQLQNNINVNFVNVMISINYILNHKFNFINKNQHICVLTSVAGLRGRKKNMFYGAAKSGLISYLSGLRQKYDKKIHVCTIIPGYINTTEFKKLGIQCPKFLITEPKKCAEIIFKSLKKKKEIVFINYFWKLIMIFIKCIPEKTFKKLSF